MHVLVTGATGFLGQYVVRALLDRGDTVRMFGRDFSGSQHLIERGAIPISGDLRDRVSVLEACAGQEVVFHAGALSAAWGSRNDFFAVNVGGTERVASACRMHGVRRLILVSSPSVIFDGSDQHNVTEAAPYPQHLLSVYSLTKKLSEDVVNTMIQTGLDAVIVRPKAIFGPGDRSLLPAILAAAREHRLVQIGSGHNLVDLTYVENVAQALLLAADAPEAKGRTYHITNNEHVPLWETIRLVLDEVGLAYDMRQVPFGIMSALAATMELQAYMTNRPPLLTRYSVAILARTQTYDISAAQHDLGYQPQVSVAEGVVRTIAALQEAALTD